MKKFWWILTCVLGILLSSACAVQPPTATWSDTTSPLASPLDSQVNAQSGNGRNLTAMEALPLAQAQARTWDPKAIFISIQPSREMQANLGLPPDTLGWFYQFQVPSTKDELFVHIIDGQVYGTTAAHPMGDSPPFTFQAIDIKRLALDNDDVVNVYSQSPDGEEYVKRYQDIEWDFRLVFLSTSPNPVWTLYDSRYPGVNLINLDAVTEQIVQDPFP